MKPVLPRAQSLPHLPVDDLLPSILTALEIHSSLVLQAAPGTGKTTRVPPALLKAQFLNPKKEILVLEPRRLAAKLSAQRVAQELGQAVGQTVGYQFRFENVTSPQTRLRFVTEGMLMRKLIADSTLSGVSAVVLDEFHERHLHSDVSLSFLRRLQKNARPDLKLIVMSATLDTQALAVFLGQTGAPAPIIQAQARQFEVQIEYLPSAPAKHLDQTVKDGVLSMLSKASGDILVFLPGMGEIRRAAQALEAIAGLHGLVIAPLHGELSKEEQDTAIKPLAPQLSGTKSKRKVILSTNVAETSLTIEGVTIVIDSGLHRQASHSWWSGVPALKTRPISRASAIQRTGRAGRLGPGLCLRLYTRGDFEGRPPFDAPEIQRADLTQTVLELESLGVQDPAAFEWFEKPQKQALEASIQLLDRLGAHQANGGGLSETGKRMAEIPAHPRLARLMIEGERLGALEDAVTLAAYLMEGKLEGIDALQSLGQARMEESVWRVRSHLMSSFPKRAAKPLQNSFKKEDRTSFAILCAFPDRVALKRPGQDRAAAQIELLLSSGGSARLENHPGLSDSDTFVILDLQEKQHLGQNRAGLHVRSLCPIHPEWLFDLEPTPLRELDEAVWDAARKRVLVSSKLVYDELTLSESRADLKIGSSATARAAEVMLKEAFGIDPSKISALSAHEIALKLAPATDPAALESLLVRISLVAKHFPETGLPDFERDPFSFGLKLFKILEGRASLSDLTELDWASAVLQACEADLGRFPLEELVPATITLPSGRKQNIQYAFNQPPWVESRLQDFFGMKRGPVILRGRLPLTLHLLAPNYRAVQVTTDLEGFWQRVYPELRPQLSRRYPRHQWPEKP